MPEVRYFKYVGIDVLLLAHAQQYIPDWPSSVTEAAISVQQWLGQNARSAADVVGVVKGGGAEGDFARPFSSRENRRVFVGVTRQNNGFL